MKFFFIFSFILSSTGLCQDNPFLAPMGSFEGITGNTGIARDGSVGAVFYNPAGLSTLTTSKISGSASAFGLSSVTTEGNGFKDTRTHINSIPTQISSIFTQKKFNWAFSILVPDSTSTNINRTTLSPEYGNYVENIDIKSQNTLIGPSIGFLSNSNFKFGLSLFLQKNERKETSDTSYGLDNGSPKYLDTYRDENTAYVFFPLFGFLYDVTSRFSFGLRFSGPSALISGHHKSTIKQYQNDGTNGEESKTDSQEKNRKYKRPMDVGIGFSFDFSDNFKVLFDISNQFETKYTAYMHDAYDENEIIDLKNVQRYNLGLEYRTSLHDALTMGLNYNPDPRKKEGYPFYNRLDFYGLTLGYRELERISDTTVGLFFNQAKSDNESSKTTYNIVGVFLSTAISFHQ
jgi:hypothetical protein